MKKLALALSFLMLSACGESRITEVDGTSVATAEKSLKAMGKGLNDNDSLKMDIEVRMLHARYKGDEFAKVLDGKDMDGFNAVVADTKAHFLAINRERFIQAEQVHIDRLTAKVERMTEIRQGMEANFDPENSIWTSDDLSSIRERKRRQEEYRTQDAEVFWSIHGCGCEEIAFNKKVKVL